MSNANRIDILEIETLINLGYSRKAIYNSIRNVPAKELDEVIDDVLENRQILRGQNKTPATTQGRQTEIGY